MDVRFVRTSVADDGPVLTEHAVAELPQLLARTDGVTWVDVPTWDAFARGVVAACLEA